MMFFMQIVKYLLMVQWLTHWLTIFVVQGAKDISS